jgi:uncharacterized membrane protein
MKHIRKYWLAMVATTVMIGGAVLAAISSNGLVFAGLVVMAGGALLAVLALRKDLIVMVDSEVDEEIKRYTRR